MNRPKKRSGFYFFMLEYRRNHQEHGRSYNNLAEVFAEVHSIWAKMSVKEQAKYVAQARAYNEAMRDYDNPLGSYHERFQKMEKERRFLARYRPSSPPPPVRVKSEPGVCQATTKPVVLPVIDGDLLTNEFYIIRWMATQPIEKIFLVKQDPNPVQQASNHHDWFTHSSRKIANVQHVL